jgi:hypothetical protein
VLKNEQHKILIRTLTTRCLKVRVNVGIQTIVYIFKLRSSIAEDCEIGEFEKPVEGCQNYESSGNTQAGLLNN